MKPDQKRVSALLVQTVSLLCKNGLHFEKGLRIQGLLGITIDDKDVFIVQIDDKLIQKNPIEEQSNSSKRRSKNEHESAGRSNYQNLSKQFLEVGTTKATGNLDQLAIEGPLVDELNDEVKSPDNDPSKAVGTDDEIIFVKSEVTEDIMDEGEPPSLELVPHVNEVQKSFTNQIAGIEELDPGEAGEYRNENDNYDLIHANQRRNYPQVNDYLMQQQFTNGSSVANPGVFDGRCSNFKDQSSSSFNETFHHLSGAQEMIKESWTFTKFKQMTRHSNNNQMIGSSGSNALIYNKSQSNMGDKRVGGEGDIFGSSGGELVPLSNPRRRSSIKTVVCQYPDCGKTFCHSCHLYRHQRLKHGRRFGVVAQTSFACQFPECGKIFYRKASLINHNFAVHNLGPRPPSPIAGEEDDVNISF